MTSATNGTTGGRQGETLPPIRIAIVEDHVILRDGLVALLEIESDLEVAGEARDVPSALVMVRSVQPDVLVTDLTFPGESGISLIATVRRQSPDLRVLVLTGHQEEEYIRAAMDAGALGYVLKDASRQELLQAIRTVAAGQQYLSSPVAQKVLSGYLRPESALAGRSPMQMLTDREREVLARIAQGGSNKSIARDLGVSVKTIEKHRANLMRKLGLHNSAEVTMFAIKVGLVSAEGRESLL